MDGKFKFTRGRNSLLAFASQALLALGALTMASSTSAAVGDTAEFSFELPVTASFSGEYPVIAILMLEETAGGIVFTVTPNQPLCSDPTATPLDPVDCNPGFTANTFITQMQIAFVDTSPLPSSLAATSNTGAELLNAPTLTNNNHIDPSYITVDGQAINFSFITANNNSDNRFFVTTFSQWTIAGLTIDQFTDVEATTRGNQDHPKPIFGSMSLSGFTGNTSNWVAQSGAARMVPEPTNLALLGIGLVGFVVARRRQARG